MATKRYVVEVRNDGEPWREVSSHRSWHEAHEAAGKQVVAGSYVEVRLRDTGA